MTAISKDTYLTHISASCQRHMYYINIVHMTWCTWREAEIWVK